MKLIKIPYDINEYNDLTEFKDTIKEINNFNKNLQSFGAKIASKYIKWESEWKDFLSESDYQKFKEQVGTKKQDNQYLYCFKTKKVKLFRSQFLDNFSFGASANYFVEYFFTDDAKYLIVKNSYETTESRGSCAKWYKVENFFYIDYINERVLNLGEFQELTSVDDGKLTLEKIEKMIFG